MEHRLSARLALAAAIACSLFVCAAVWIAGGDESPSINVQLSTPSTRSWFFPLAEVQPADAVYIYWGGEIDRFDSAKVVHSLVTRDLDHAPEYISSFSEQTFRGLSLECCNMVIFPPFAHGYPVFGHDSAEARRITRFVAQGNTAIVTGGFTDALFLNDYFGFQLETIPSGYSAGPFIVRHERLPAALQGVSYFLPRKLHQVHTQATVISRASLPFPSTILYDDLQGGTPVFILKYCMVNNPKIGELPFKVNPMSCPKWAKRGNPCGCGNIVYIGFDYRDMVENDWNQLLREITRWVQNPPKPSAPKKKAAGGGGKTAAAAAAAAGKKQQQGGAAGRKLRTASAQGKSSRSSPVLKAAQRKLSVMTQPARRIKREARLMQQQQQQQKVMMKKKGGEGGALMRLLTGKAEEEKLVELKPHDRDWEISVKRA